MTTGSMNEIREKDAVEVNAMTAERGEASAPLEAAKGLPYGIIDPDYARIFTIARTLAWNEGYAIAMQGSFTRDLDMLAVPWTDAACEPEHLVKRIEAATGTKDNKRPPSKKPHGRLAWTLRMPEFGDPRFVDVSVLPRLGAQSEEIERLKAHHAEVLADLDIRIEHIEAENVALREQIAAAQGQKPVGVVDESDEGLFADFTTDQGCLVKRGDKLYATPVPQQPAQQALSVSQVSNFVEGFLDAVEEPPERNCSCHISPPCADCVDHSGLRGVFSDARRLVQAIASIRQTPMQQPAEPEQPVNAELLDAALDLRHALSNVLQRIPSAEWPKWLEVRHRADMAIAAAKAAERCPRCDGSGHVHTPDGEWRGPCSCNPARPAEKAADQSVTPEYLAWLESLNPPRNGIGGNEAWNAGVAWAGESARASPCNTSSDALYLAAIDCRHMVDRDAVTLYFDRSLPGNNALDQLRIRLEAALDTLNEANKGLQVPASVDHLRGIDAGPIAEWVDLVKRGYVPTTALLIRESDAERVVSAKAKLIADPVMGGRESLEDALAIVESFGPGTDGLNDTYARQILLADAVKTLRASVRWYKRRADLLQEWQSKMRDPERTIVCDILANGQLLPDLAGKRYGVQSAPEQSADTVEEAWDNHCAKYDLESTQWLDMGSDEYFKAGWAARAAVEKVEPEQAHGVAA